MKYAPYELPATFEGGEPLIPDGWTAFLWAESEEHQPQVHPGSLPSEGSIVALLLDARIVPSDAIMINVINNLPDQPTPKSGDVINVLIHQMFTAKSKIRQVVLARYNGLDSYGYPDFTNVGRGSDNPKDSYRGFNFINHDAVAWQPIEIPYLPDVTI